MFVRLCDSRVTVKFGDADPVPLTNQAARFLRLLLLWGDDDSETPVSVDLAAHVLGVKCDGMPTYVRQLRGLLGDGDTKSVIRTVSKRPANYAISMQADIHRFRELTDGAREAAGTDWGDHRNLTRDAARDAAPLLREALGMWRGSPALGFDVVGNKVGDQRKLKDVTKVDEQRVRLVDIFDRWQERHADAVLLRADCILASADRGTYNEVLGQVVRLANSPVPDERVWYRLLLLATGLGDKKRHRDFYARAREYYEDDEEDVPPEIEELKPKVPEARRGATTTRARPISDIHKTAKQPQVEGRNGIADLVRIAEALGIAAPSSLELGKVGLSPIECTKRAENGLDFAGVLAGKWVDNRDTYDSFVGMLRRFHSRDPRGRARFLVIDPRSEAYDRLVQIRGGEVSPNSVKTLLTLKQKYPCLEVRGTNRLPAFRVLVIDDDIVTVSPYDLENQSVEASRLGWKAPHMLLDPLAPFPLAPAFRLYFETEWHEAELLELSTRSSG